MPAGLVRGDDSRRAIHSGGITATTASVTNVQPIHLGNWTCAASSCNSSTWAAPTAFRNERVFSTANRASDASINKKKRSAVARRKRSLRKTGCASRGKPFRANMPKKAVKALNRMITSKVTGMFAGRLNKGLPLTTNG